MAEEDLKRARDEARCESAVQTLVDVVQRFEETSEGNYTVYDLVGYLVEDLLRDGCCPACFSETLIAVCQDVGADPTQHLTDEEGTIH